MVPEITQSEKRVEDEWWRGAVIYQIYPRSFQDSNGDGIGDLAGITSRLEYVASLGVDAIWLSPFFASPMKDFGYDVSDYCDVHPVFGTLADFDTLLATAHSLGLKVLIDLVLSHSSDKHAWFIESRQSEENTKSDWYVWAEPKPDGTAPNNWLSVFGGSAWQWDGRRQQYYLHNFLSSQPDLNFHNPEVRRALLNVARFWLDKGVDGFRLDTINFYFHDKELRDNPPLKPEERNAIVAPTVNPYNYQNHLYSKNQDENLEFLQELRALLDLYRGRVLLGEVGDAQRGIELLGQYTAGNQRVHMCYIFEFLSMPATASWVEKIFSRLGTEAPDSWPCWGYSNHDVVRHVSRWGLSEAALRCYVMLLVTLRGSAYLFQGEELGLGEADVPYEALQDPYGIEFWPEFKGRDGCRTPMVWDPEYPYCGFSDAQPWLPLGTDHPEKSVANQEQDPASVLHHYRAAIALRKSLSALRRGQQHDLVTDENLLTFLRSYEDKIICCLFQLGDEVVSARLGDGQWQVCASSSYPPGQDLNGEITLSGWGYLIAQKTVPCVEQNS